MSLGYIRPRHSEIARRLILGQTQAQICRELGMNQGRMSLIVNSPLFVREVKRLERERDAVTVDVTRQIREAAPDALEVLQRTMYMGKTERIKYDAARDLLDRAGYSAVQKVAVATTKVDTSNMQDTELRDLLVNRLQRSSANHIQDQAELAEASKVTLSFDEPDEVCSTTEQELPTMSQEQKDKLIHILEHNG